MYAIKYNRKKSSVYIFLTDSIGPVFPPIVKNISHDISEDEIFIKYTDWLEKSLISMNFVFCAKFICFYVTHLPLKRLIRRFVQLG